MRQAGALVRQIDGDLGRITAQDGQRLIRALQEQPRRVPSVFCYDNTGSRLFELRTEQPEYYLRRLEIEVLNDISAKMFDITGPADFCEIGCGSARKLEYILDAYTKRPTNTFYFPIDINELFLREAKKLLKEQFPTLTIAGYAGTYEEGLSRIPQSGRPRILLWLGSSIGNLLDRELHSFIDLVFSRLSCGDYFLVGADLIKDPVVLERAYDDARNVGKRMELNTLSNLNQWFDANFALEEFSYNTQFCTSTSTVRALLTARRAQNIRLAALDWGFVLKQGEPIQIGNMRKFRLPELQEDFAARGFELCHVGTDSKAWYAVLLFRRGR